MTELTKGMAYTVEDGTKWITRHKPKYERVQVPSYRLDKHAFADALATALGGTTSHEDAGRGQYNWVRVHVDGMAIHIGTQYGAKADQFCLGIDTPKEWHAMSGFATAPKLPDICVSSQRPIAQIAADVRRRLIDSAKEPLAKGAAKLAEFRQVRDALALEAGRLTERYPGMKVTVKDNATMGDIYYNVEGGTYLSGRLYHDGTVTFDRLDSLKGDRRNAVLDALLTK